MQLTRRCIQILGITTSVFAMSRTSRSKGLHTMTVLLHPNLGRAANADEIFAELLSYT